MCLLERSTSIILTANSESISQFLVSFQDLAWAFRKTGQLRFEADHTPVSPELVTTKHGPSGGKPPRHRRTGRTGPRQAPRPGQWTEAFDQGPTLHMIGATLSNR